MPVMRACACGEPSTAICSIPGSSRSPANTGLPVTRALPSTLRSLFPTTLNASSIVHLPHSRCGELHSLDRLDVPGAAAKVAAKRRSDAVSYTHLRAHETVLDL